jgi:hypothetical protein
VAINNSSGGTTFANSLPINASNLKVLAGNTETGLNGSALSAILQPRNALNSDSPSLAVASNGTIYYRDVINGIVYINPQDGILRQLTPLGATVAGQGDGGPATAAKLQVAQSFALDYQGRLVVLDGSRIRRIDLNQSPPTISTIIGGGSNTAPNKVDTIANPLNLYIGYNGTVLKVLPNGDIYFSSEAWIPGSANTNRIRRYVASTNSIISIYPNGPGAGSPLVYSNGTVTDVSVCYGGDVHMSFDPVTSNITNMMISGGGGYAGCFTGTTDWSNYLLNPTTGLAIQAAPDVSNNFVGTPLNFWFKNIDAHDGNMYINSNSWISKYNSISNTWTRIVGTGTLGSCADGTAATSCQIFASTGYVDANGTLYFTDRGRIRVVSGGNVVTVAGQSLNFGEGGLATNARFGSVTSLVQKTSNSAIVVMDQINSRIRNFTRGGNISTIAGTDVNGIPDFVTAATAQPTGGTPLIVLDANDTIYYPTSSSQRLIALANSVGAAWSQFMGFGATNYASANNILASSIAALGCCTAQVMGYNGTSLLYSNLNVVGEVNLTTGINLINIGPTTAGANYLCASGTALGSCGVYSQINPSVMADWDSVNNKWLLMNSDLLTVATFANGDATLGTAVTLPRQARSIRFKAVGSTRYLYYCANSTGVLYLRNLGTGAEISLPLPTATMKCAGSSIHYDSTNGSLVFPFTQNGLYGVAELFNVNPSANGM